MPKENKNSSLYWLLLIPVAMFGLLGTVFGSLGGHPLSGLLWGLVISLGVIAVALPGNYAWEWFKKQMDKGKLMPYIFIAVVISVAICAYLALTLGKPSCDEYDDSSPQSSCVQYADNGYDATTDQRWAKFWNTLPVTVIIASLIATIVHNNIHKRK